MSIKNTHEKDYVPTKIRTNRHSEKSPDMPTNKEPDKTPEIQIDFEPSQFPPLSSNIPVSSKLIKPQSLFYGEIYFL